MCTFSLFFNPVPSIRRSAFVIEDSLRLKGYIAPFQVMSIPDDAPFELPRISAQTEHGHTRLTVTAQSAQVQTDYDERYSGDIEKCLVYSKNKAKDLIDALERMPEINTLFAGLSIRLLFPKPVLGIAPIDFIKRTYLNVSSNLPMFDASIRAVYTVDDDYYLNLEVNKWIKQDPISVNINPQGVSISKPASSHEEMLAVSIDFNNRLAFNQGRFQSCSKETIDSLYRRVELFLNNGINDFLLNGEVKF